MFAHYLFIRQLLANQSFVSQVCVFPASIVPYLVEPLDGFFQLLGGLIDPVKLCLLLLLHDRIHLLFCKLLPWDYKHRSVKVILGKVVSDLR
jgi:hypothetical protein